MELGGSLLYVRVILRALCENIARQGELADFLLASNFYASVFSAILTVNDRLLASVMADLSVFLEKAEKFKNEKEGFADYWPGDQEGAVMNKAFCAITGELGKDGHYFGAIVGTVKEALETMKDYEAFRAFKNLYLGRCGL